MKSFKVELRDEFDKLHLAINEGVFKKQVIDNVNFNIKSLYNLDKCRVQNLYLIFYGESFADFVLDIENEEEFSDNFNFEKFLKEDCFEKLTLLDKHGKIITKLLKVNVAEISEKEWTFC